jgi:glutamate dehydrogenase (NAD(P)+)
MDNRPCLLRMEWADTESPATGYLVIDRVLGGLAAGGTRIRRGVTLAEVEDLARTMSLKAAVHDAEIGGAKAAIDHDPAAPDIDDVLARFFRAVRPLISRLWVTGEDLGVSQDQINEAIRRAGLDLSVEAALPRTADAAEAARRVRAALAIRIDGVALPDLVGGLGIAETVTTIWDARGWDRGQARAVIQGFGSMGGSSALYLDRAGVKVIGVIDAEGGIINPDGLDVPGLLAARSARGIINRTALRPGDRQIPREDWLSIDADVLIPAALSYVLDERNAGDVKARLVVEAANCPTTAEAEAALHGRGILVVPDFVANGAALKWWWATIIGEIEADGDQAIAAMRAHMRELVGRGLAIADRERIALRQAMLQIADANLARMKQRYSEWAEARTSPYSLHT